MASVVAAAMLATAMISSDQPPEVDLDLTGGALRQTGREVDPGHLLSQLDAGDRVVVLDTPRRWGGTVLFASSERSDLNQLRDALVVTGPDSYFHCMCIGGPAIEVYKGQEQLLTATVHHGVSIRTSLWDSDAMLADSESLLRWFEARGMDGPRREVVEAKARAERSEAAERRWVAAMPRGLRPLWDASRAAILGSPLAPEPGPWREVLEREFPDPRDRVLALLGWFGSGEGPWSGFPSYEVLAEELLLDFSTRQLVEVVAQERLNEAQLEGAARLFGGWDFSKRRPGDVGLLPESLKAALLEHSVKTSDDDKRRRAVRAFGE